MKKCRKLTKQMLFNLNLLTIAKNAINKMPLNNTNICVLMLTGTFLHSVRCVKNPTALKSTMHTRDSKKTKNVPNA